MKKTAGYILLAIFAIAVLFGAYLFLTKGYQTGKTKVGDMIQNVIENKEENNVKVSENGSVSSEKIYLIITSPKDGATLNTSTVTVQGKTVPNAEVFVDDKSGKADANGNFSISEDLDEGKNQIVVNANDANGNVTEQDLTVNVSTFE